MQTVQSPPQNTAPSELYAFDALRAMAALVVVYAHSTMSFYLPFWVGIQDVSSDRLARLILHESIELAHCIVLPVFFAVSGFFTRRSVLRHGAGRMLRDRVRRVLIPLGVAVLTVVPVLRIVQEVGQARAGHTSAQLGRFIAHGGPWQGLGPHYLWFLYFLMIYSAVAAVAGRNAKAPTQPAAPSRAEQAFAWLCRSDWAPLALTLPTLLVIGGVCGPIIAEVGRHFFAQPPLVVLYGLYFWFGWWLQRMEHCLPSLARTWKPHLIGGLIVWLVGTAILLSFHSEQTDFRIPHPPAAEANRVPDELPLDGPWSPVFPVYQFLKGYLGWTFTLGFIGLAMQVCNRPRPWVRYLADASYWLYLAHAPLLMAVQVAVAEWPIPWWFKLPAIDLFVVGLLLLMYPYVVRTTGLFAGHRPKQEKR
jgi:peptidoglycan/LPS O-acetylase OafA/YrhL